MSPEPGQLRGWKEIAGRLNVSERSAKRWENTRGLPVHRVPGSSRDAVFARADELDGWLECPHARPFDDVEADAGPPEAHPAVGDSPLPATIGARTRFATLASASVVLVTILIAAWAWSRTPAKVEKPDENHGQAEQPTESAGGSVSALGPPILLELSIAGGSSTKIGIGEGDCGSVEVTKRVRVDLCARTHGDGLLLDILVVPAASSIGEASASKKVTLLMERNARIRVLGPISIDVEWISAGPAPSGSPKAPSGRL